MWRIVAICWVFIAPVLAGILVMIAIMTPALANDHLGAWIAYAAVLGAILGVPAAYLFAKSQAGGLPSS